MENKKKLYIAFIILFFVICIIPSAGMIIFGASESGANEILTQKPSLTEADGSFNHDILNNVSDYINDRFAFRQELITAYSTVCADVFNVSANDKVTLGKDGWLFYTETLDDYLNQNVLNERDIFCIAHNLSLIQEYSESLGAQFIFTIAPNKNSIYPEFMPEVGESMSEKGNVELLAEALSHASVSYADLFSVLKDIKIAAINSDSLQLDEPSIDIQQESILSGMTDANGNILLYHRLDSHWNNVGAAAANDGLMNYLRKSDANIVSDNPYKTVKTHDGDLYSMLFPVGNEKDYNAEFNITHSFEFQDENREPDSITIKTSCSGKSGSLLMFRDSFGNALYPFMADSFAASYFTRRTPYDMTFINELGADTVVLEIVERNIPDLLEKAALFPAPSRKGVIPEEVNDSLNVTFDNYYSNHNNNSDELLDGSGKDTDVGIITDTDTDIGSVFLRNQGENCPDGYVMFSGVITGTIDTDSPVYLEFSSSIYEASLSGSDFAAFIPESETDDFTGSVIAKADGKIIRIEAN